MAHAPGCMPSCVDAGPYGRTGTWPARVSSRGGWRTRCEPRARRPRDPETDTAILRAALEVFIERGVEGASMEQIAKRAGVGKLTVYRRWATKEELIAQAIEWQVSAEIVPSPADLQSLSNQEIIEQHYILPRREMAAFLLKRAQQEGGVPADATWTC